MRPEGYPIRFSGGQGVWHYRFERGEDSNLAPRPAEFAAVHVEGRRPGFHWAIRLVCACGEAVPAADDLRCLPVPADSACPAGVTFRLVGKLDA